MPTRLDSIVVDSADPSTLGAWWARALGWTASEFRWTNSDGSPGIEIAVEPPDGEPGVPLTFGPVADPKVGINRVHLDLHSRTVQEQTDTIAALVHAGAVRVDVGQGSDAAFVVLADPEGNELCVLEPRGGKDGETGEITPDPYEGSGIVAAIVVAALDPPTLARFWAAASGWDIVTSAPEYAALQQPDGPGPLLELIARGEPHTSKNRWHLDVRPGHDDDHHGEVARLLDLGAKHVDVGQSRAAISDITWVVLADPEGNEFCVLRPA